MIPDETAMFSTSSSGRTILHVAVIAGHEEIVKNLVKERKDKLVKMKDKREIFCVALNLLKQIPDMPLAHKSKSDGVQPLYALARMCSMFPSGSRYGFIQRFLYKSKFILPSVFLLRNH
ncbi:Ankyrin repeat family protein [Trifolium repens]|nr:Ankyrin repeat family protein [Trifolium repens]